MARLPRLCVPGWPHLVIQHGHRDGQVFVDDGDRLLFFDQLQAESRNHGVAIHAYALCATEVRILGTPSGPESLSRMMQAVGRRYGAHFNRRHGHVGTVWQGRFRSTVIEPERHLLACMQFVEQGFVPNGASAGAAHKNWSSAAHHAGGDSNSCVTDHLLYWSLGNTPFEREAAYREITQRVLTSAELEQIANAALKGWPLGSTEFVAELSGNTSRRLAPLPRGRPRKPGAPSR